MSLKTLISVSGRLTGDPSSCHENFILFSKKFKAGFPDFSLHFQLDLKAINRKSSPVCRADRYLSTQAERRENNS